MRKAISLLALFGLGGGAAIAASAVKPEEAIKYR